MIAGKVKPICNYEDDSFLPRRGENQSFEPADEQQCGTDPFSPCWPIVPSHCSSLLDAECPPCCTFPFRGTSCTLLRRLQCREAPHQAAKRPGNCPLLEIICNGQDEEKELSFVTYFLPFLFFLNAIKGSHPAAASLRLLTEAWKKLKNGNWKKKSAFQTNSSLVSPAGLLHWRQQPVS